MSSDSPVPGVTRLNWELILLVLVLAMAAFSVVVSAGTVIADFEDGTDGFGDSYWNGQDCSMAFEGDCSYYGEETSEVGASADFNISNSQSLVYAVYLKAEPKQTAGTVKFFDQGTEIVNITPSTNPAGVDLQPDAWYEIRVTDINYTSETYTLEVYRNGSLEGSQSGLSFEASTNGVDQIGLYGGGGVNASWDYIRRNATATGAPGGGGDSGVDDDEKLRIETREYLEHNTTVPFEVWLYNNSTDSYDNVTTDPDLNVTVENTSVVTVSGASITSTNDTTINQVTWVNATWEPTGLNDSQKVVVANETIENVDILPPMQKFTASVGTPDMQVVLIATGVGAGIGLLATSLAGIGGFTLVIIAGWLGGYSETHTLIAGLLIALFVGLNVSQLVEFNGR